MTGFPQRPLSAAAAAERDADPYEFARQIALRSLDAAPRSRHQLRERLLRRGVDAETVERVLDRFTEVGLLDDDAYARMLVRAKRTSRGLAPRALALELRRAGIDDETAAAAVAETVDDAAESEEDIAARLVRKRLRSMNSVPDDVAVRRLVGMLGRKGYGHSLAARVVREILHETRAAEDGGSNDGSQTTYRRRP